MISATTASQAATKTPHSWEAVICSDRNRNGLQALAARSVSLRYHRVPCRFDDNRDMQAGAGGGFATSVAMYPLEAARSKLQIPAERYHGGLVGEGKLILRVLGFSLRAEGLMGLYRGVGPKFMYMVPKWAIYFAVYDGMKTSFGGHPLGRTEAAARVKGYQPFREHPWSLHVVSAVTAGAASTILTHPLEPGLFWYMRYQHGVESNNLRVLDAVQQMYRGKGNMGLMPRLLHIPHLAVQFSLYEQLKSWASKIGSLCTSNRRVLNYISGGDFDAPLPSSKIICCSTIATMSASITTFPLMVLLRTRLIMQQAAARKSKTYGGGIIYTTRNILQKASWTGLYGGVWGFFCRCCLSHNATMLA